MSFDWGAPTYSQVYVLGVPNSPQKGDRTEIERRQKGDRRETEGSQKGDRREPHESRWSTVDNRWTSLTAPSLGQGPIPPSSLHPPITKPWTSLTVSRPLDQTRLAVSVTLMGDF